VLGEHQQCIRGRVLGSNKSNAEDAGKQQKGSQHEFHNLEA
jgi:hypothetical protein